MEASANGTAGVCEVDNDLNDLEGFSLGAGAGLAFGTEGASLDAQKGPKSFGANSDLGILPGIGMGAHAAGKICFTKRIK